jgi:hypothetical protein
MAVSPGGKVALMRQPNPLPGQPDFCTQGFLVDGNAVTHTYPSLQITGPSGPAFVTCLFDLLISRAQSCGANNCDPAFPIVDALGFTDDGTILTGYHFNGTINETQQDPVYLNRAGVNGGMDDSSLPIVAQSFPDDGTGGVVLVCRNGQVFGIDGSGAPMTVSYGSLMRKVYEAMSTGLSPGPAYANGMGGPVTLTPLFQAIPNRGVVYTPDGRVYVLSADGHEHVEKGA